MEAVGFGQLNVEQIGGQARVMMVATEIEAAARVMAIGVGCPIELVWGGLNYTGASVALINAVRVACASPSETM